MDIFLAMPIIWIIAGVIYLLFGLKKRCPYCKSRIHRNANICKNCRKEI